MGPLTADNGITVNATDSEELFIIKKSIMASGKTANSMESVGLSANIPIKLFFDANGRTGRDLDSAFTMTMKTPQYIVVIGNRTDGMGRENRRIQRKDRFLSVNGKMG